MNTQHEPAPQPHRSLSARRGLVITAVAAAALLGGAAVASATTSADVGGDAGSSATPTATAPDTGGPTDTTAGGTTTQDTTAGDTSAGDTSAGRAASPAHLPHLDGEVSTVQEGTVLITDHDGFTRTVLIGDNTTYGDGISLPIEVGEHIHAEGTVAADGTSLDASVISEAPTPRAPGAEPAGEPGRGGPPVPADGKAPALPAPPSDDDAPTPPTGGSVPQPDAPKPEAPTTDAPSAGAPTAKAPTTG